MKNPFNIFYPLFAVALLPLLFSCGSNNGGAADADGCIVLDMEQALDGNAVEMNLGKYASSIRYIPLQTNENSVIGSVGHLKTDGRYFYLTSVAGGGEVKVFSADGRFVRRLGNKGRGPGEYLSAGGLFIDERGKETQIGVMTLNKSVIYNGDGGFVRDLEGYGNIGMQRASDIECAGKKNYAVITSVFDSAGVRIEHLRIVDSTGRLLSDFPLGKEHSTLVHISIGGTVGIINNSKSSGCYLYDGKINVVKGAMDTVYAYDMKDYSRDVRYRVSLGKYAPLVYDTPDLSESITLLSNDFFETDNFVLIKGIVPFKNLPDFDLPENSSKRAWVIFVYDKAGGSFDVLAQNGPSEISSFVNDLDGGMAFCPSFIENGKMYQLVDAIDFMEAAQESDSAGMKRVAAQLTEDSNPVIVEVTLK